VTVAVQLAPPIPHSRPLDEPDRRSTAPIISIRAGGATVSDVVAVARHGVTVEVGAEALLAVRGSRAVVDRALAAGDVVYGLNTGVGSRRDERLSSEALLDYQNRLVSSHAGGVGAPLPDADVRAAMFTRAIGICMGGSGASPAVLTALVALLNAGVHPLVPRLGSVGAADLGHMSAVAAVLTGHGRARLNGKVLTGAQALEAVGLAPVVLRPKDGIALISCNAVSIGSGALAVAQAERVADLADLAGALSVEALSGNLSPFDPEVHRAKPFVGQSVSAARILDLLRGSRLERPEAAVSLQDPLSLRTIPQVHGAFRDQVCAAQYAVTVELNGWADNPLISASSGRAISNGNFHPMVMALAFESLRIGIAHVGTLAERRIAKLTATRHTAGSIERDARVASAERSFTVPYLLEHSAALLTTELRRLAAPVSLAPPSLAGGHEDHATLAPQAVLLSRTALDQLELLLTIEVMLAAALLEHRDLLELGHGTRWAYEHATAVVGRAGPDDSAADVVEWLHAGLLDHVESGHDGLGAAEDLGCPAASVDLGSAAAA
jgi:histidine ammonia-lyase